MLTDSVMDYKLQHMVQKRLSSNPHDRHKFKSIVHCGNTPIRLPAAQPATWVIANEKTSSFFGLQHCGNAWICPVCEARVMSKHATDIACAIDALKKKPHNQKAFMITFTVLHSKDMSCETVTNILYQSWKDFIVRGNKQLKQGKRKQKTVDGKKTYTYDKNKSRYVGHDPFAEFSEHFNCKHRIRVGEYTWSEKHGWHPHFHCLFWVDADKFDDVIKFEERLRERWTAIVKKNTVKELDKACPKYLTRNEKQVELMYSKANSASKTLFISKTKDGKPIVQESSMYVCGWGADKELTGNYQRKASNEGHYTTHQLLEMALDEPKYLETFMEFAYTIKSHKTFPRKRMSQSGLRKIIDEYKKTNDYIETVKKKFTELESVGGKRKVLGWFNEQQWLHITVLEIFSNQKIKSEILRLALSENPVEEINKFLEQYDIKLNPPETHELSQLIENQILVKYSA